MSSFTVSMIVELLVAGLLAATIAYCVRLNRRLTLLKSDEQALRATIAELVTATEIAERAIQGLKVTVRECDGTLGERLRTAERFLADIDREVRAGQVVVDRIARITEAANDADAEFGRERLITTVAAERTRPIHAIVRRVDAALTEFAGTRPPGDDRTLVVVRMRRP